MKPNVLIVTDDEVTEELARVILEPYARVVVARSIAGAMRELRSYPDFAYITLSGHAPQDDNLPRRHNDTTLLLARHILIFYSHIPTYAAASDNCVNEALIKIGCLPSPRFDVFLKIKEKLETKIP